MAKAKIGLFNPANFAEDSGSGFREGLVKVIEADFRVQQRDARQGQKQEDPHPALVLKCHVLDPDTQEPREDKDGEPEKVELSFGLGSKALSKIHPGASDSPDSDEVEDLGDEVGAKGNTVSVLDSEFRLHPKTGAAMFFLSLEKAGFKPAYLNRMWAPDMVGCVFEMATHQEPTGEKEMKDGKERDRTIPYKIVKKLVRASYEGKGGKGKDKEGKGDSGAGGSTSAGSSKGKQSDGNVEVVEALSPILMKLSETLDGQTISLKALGTKVNAAATEAGVNPKLLVPMLALAKNADWIEANGKRYDMKMEDGMVKFGE